MDKQKIFFLIAVFWTLAAAPGQESGLDTSVEAGFRFRTFEAAAGSTTWKTNESVILGVSARYGNNLEISAEIESDFNETPLTADKVLRKLSLSFSPLPMAMVTVGKQNLKWGTARVFSSIDSLLPSLDPLDPASTNRGVTGFRIELIPSSWISFSVFALPSTILRETRLALRSEILAGETDIALGAIRGVNQEGEEEPSFTADFARFFNRFGFYGECQIIKKKDWEPSATAGLQIDFPAWLNGTISLLGEYRYQDDNAFTKHMIYTGLSGIPVINI